MKLRFIRKAQWLLLLTIGMTPGIVYAQNDTSAYEGLEAETSAAGGAPAFGKISRNFYRSPYQSPEDIRVTNDYITHGTAIASQLGRIDVVGLDSNDPVLVAMAGGEIIGLNDNRTECGCDLAYGSCTNAITIRHANGETTQYLHIQPNSATGEFGLSVGDDVTPGQPVAREGKVGLSCGNDGAATAGNCVMVVPPGAGDCGDHVHITVRREATTEIVNPMICGISGNLFVDGNEHTSTFCSTVGCPTNQTFTSLTLDSLGEFQVIQADDDITMSDDIFVDNQGSLVMHAGDSVRMLPGFHCDRGGYCRAEIGLCHTTTPLQPGGGNSLAASELAEIEP